MRTRIAYICLPLMLISCGEGKFAERYAARMAEVLKTYRERVEVKIQAEQQSYVDLAKIYDAAEITRIKDNLDKQRNTQSQELTDRVMQAKQQASPGAKFVWSSEVHSALQGYAEADFKQSEALLTREMDAYKKTLQDLDDLSVERENLEKLHDLLATLARPKSTIEQLKFAAEFGCEVNRNYRVLEVNRELTDIAKKIDAEKDADKKKSLQTQKSSLQDEAQKLETPCKTQLGA
jgi:hypothetical protein